MSWNYRVVKKTYKDGEVYFEFREVYYNITNDDNTIWGMTQSAARVIAEDQEGLLWVLDKMRESLKKPILDIDDIKYVERSGESDESK